MRIAICNDDEIYMKNCIKEITEEITKQLHISSDIFLFTDGHKLLKEFQQEKEYDIVILDIDMPTFNGKELAKKLRLMNTSFSLIFIASYKKEVYRTLQYQADAFISKDSEKSIIISELTRIIVNTKESNPYFEWFKIIEKNKEKNMVRIIRKDIYYFNKVNRHVIMHTYDKEYILVERTFQTLKDRYKNEKFHEISRGYFVNLNHVTMVKREELLLDNNEKVC